MTLHYLLLFFILLFIIKFVSLSWFLQNYHFYGLSTACFLYEEEISVRIYARQRSLLKVINIGRFSSLIWSWGRLFFLLRICHLLRKIFLTACNSKRIWYFSFFFYLQCQKDKITLSVKVYSLQALFLES